MKISINGAETQDPSFQGETLEEVMKRGRWRALNSVHRYAKPHAWYAAKAKLGHDEKQKGSDILEARTKR